MRYFIFSCCFLFIALSVHSQASSTKEFSRLDSNMSAINKLLSESRLLHIRDSIRTALLTAELSNLKNPKLAEQQVLLDKLAQVKHDDSLRLENQKKDINQLKLRTAGAPVKFYSDTLFSIYTSLGPFSAERRAIDAEHKIESVYKLPRFIPDSLRILKQHGLTNIIYGTQIITSINQTDALWHEQTQDSLARHYRDVLRVRINEAREEHSFTNILLHLAYSAAVLLGLVVLWWLINTIYKKTKLALLAGRRKTLKGFRVGNYEVLKPGHLVTFFMILLRGFRFVVLLLLVYLSLSLALSFFPETSNWTHILLHWIWQPVKDIGRSLIHYLPKLFKIAVIVLITRSVIQVIHFFSKEIGNGDLKIKGFYEEWAEPTFKIVRFLLYVFSFIIIFPYLPGSDSLAFRGVSVFLGILLSIGSSSAIGNTVAGIVITYMRPFRLGDWIQINNLKGYVIEKTILITRIRTINNEDVTIPNSTVLSNHTVNYTSSGHKRGLVISAEATVNYHIPGSKVYELLEKAAYKTMLIDADQAPFVFHKALNDFYITYQVNLYTLVPERMYHIQSDLYKNIQLMFDEAGIDLSSTHQVSVKPPEK